MDDLVAPMVHHRNPTLARFPKVCSCTLPVSVDVLLSSKVFDGSRLGILNLESFSQFPLQRILLGQHVKRVLHDSTLDCHVQLPPNRILSPVKDVDWKMDG